MAMDAEDLALVAYAAWRGTSVAHARGEWPAPDAKKDPVAEKWRAVGRAIAAATARQELTAEQVNYPRDVFAELIDGNSPYAYYLFQWVAYQTDAKRWRLKMMHDVRTFDGREAFGIWPNGSSCGPFRDDEVEFIRISRKQHGVEWVDPRPERTDFLPPAMDGAMEAGKTYVCDGSKHQRADTKP